MTYKELLKQISQLNPAQLEWEVAIEVIGLEEIFRPLELRVCDSEHDYLEEDHPVIFVP